MPLRHALLGLLASKPQTGYELTRVFDRSLRNAWHASHSQVYPELARLESLGMVEVVAEGARGSRTWAATPAGRAELRRWLTATEPNRAVRNESAVRLFLVFLLAPAERVAVLERDLAYVEERSTELDAIAAQLAELPHDSAFSPVVTLGQRIDAVTSEWLREQIAIARAGKAEHAERADDARTAPAPTDQRAGGGPTSSTP